MTEALVPPALLGRLERLGLASRARLNSTGRGERRSRMHGSSMQFADYRAYTLGDDPRQVDWNAYGRTGNLIVKLFEDETLLDVHICLDVSASMDWGEPNKLACARRLAGALGYIALARYDRLHAIALGSTLGSVLGPIWGRDQASRLFDGLSSWRGSGETDLERALRGYVARGSASAGLAIVISDFLSATWEGGLRALIGRRHQLAVIHVLAPEEVSPAMGEEVRLIDRESGEGIEIHLDAFALDQYARRFADWTGAIERFCADHGAAYARINSAASLESAVFETCRTRRIVV